MSLYKDIGIELDETLEALDEEKGMDMSMPDFPLAFLNAEVGDETPEKPIPFGEQGGDMQYLVDVFSTALLDDTYDEVARYARRELRYPDYMIVRARALAGRSPGARPVRYGRDRAHRSRFVGESTRVGPKRAPVRSGYF